MKRFLSQQIFCSPQKILQNTVVEINNQNIITNLIAMDNQQTETSNTLYYNGIISSGIMPVSSIVHNNITNHTFDFQYINLQKTNSKVIIRERNKPVILDFNTTDISAINIILKEKKSLFSHFHVFEIIAGCTFYPAIYLGLTNEIELHNHANLIIWEKIKDIGNDFYWQILKI